MNSFNEVRYQGLLDDLEISEISFSNLDLDNEKFRLDSEFFQKKYLKSYEKIKLKPYEILGTIVECLADYHANGAYENLLKNVEMLDHPEYAYMVRSTDLEKNDYLSNVKYVSQSSYEYLAKTKLFGGELLINKIGSPGRVYLMPNIGTPATVGMNLFMARFNKKSKFNEKYVWIFLNTSIGKQIIKRKVNGTVPLTMDKDAVRSIYIPKLSESFQKTIVDLVECYESLNFESKAIYCQAEKILFDNLGLNGFTLSKETINIKKFSNSFALTGRLDAEYYQPKYEQIIEKVVTQRYDKLCNLVSISKSVEPGTDAYSEEEGVPFLRVADFSKYGLLSPQKYLNSSYTLDNSKKLEGLKPKKGSILFSKDGSVGEAFCLKEDANFITSGAILNLTLKDEATISPEYLTLVLNSSLVRNQAERDAGGSIILHWRIEEINNVVVPLLPFLVQENIEKLTRKSFRLKTECEKLLELAKKAVEIAIEQNEDSAIKFINDESKKV